jgi:hypothetical protein
MKKENFNLEVNEGTLTLSGERKPEKPADGVEYHRSERLSGKSSRSFYLPQTVKLDAINASYRDGILEIHVPKADEPNRARLQFSKGVSYQARGARKKELRALVRVPAQNNSERFDSNLAPQASCLPHFPAFTWRTIRSSKNCEGLAVFASGMDSERKPRIPCRPGSEVTSSLLKPARL